MQKSLPTNEVYLRRLFFTNKSLLIFLLGIFVKRQQPFWIKAKKFFSHAGKAKQKLTNIVQQERERKNKVTLNKFIEFFLKMIFVLFRTNLLLMKVLI